VEELQRRAEEVGLVRTESSLGPVPLPDIEDADSTDSFIESYLRASVPEPIGMRTTEQIVARLMEKLRNANDPAEFRRALELIAEISALVGEPSAVMERGRAVAANHGVGAAPFDELGRLFQRLDDASIRADVTLDLGHARGIAYYTGVIFEMMDGPLSLGGGGRYDGLVAALGGGNVPAMGFAYNLDHVLNALAATKA
jgi:histidyl-tRNA synthetase